MVLDKKVQYKILRTGPDTKDTEQHLVYILKYMPKYGWTCMTSAGKSVYNGTESVYQSPNYFKILGEDGPSMPQAERYGKTDKAKRSGTKTGRTKMDFPIMNEIEEEKVMSFNEVVEEAMVIEMGVIMVNGSRLDKFSDAKVIAMIKAERDKLDTLAVDLGMGSKYYEAKKVGINANIQILADVLDSRVI